MLKSHLCMPLVEASHASYCTSHTCRVLFSGIPKRKVAPIGDRKPWNVAKESTARATASRKSKMRTPQKEKDLASSLGELKGSSVIGLLRSNTKPDRFGYSPNSKCVTPTKPAGGVVTPENVHEKENLQASNVRSSQPHLRANSAKKATRAARITGGRTGSRKSHASRVSKSVRKPKCSVSPVGVSSKSSSAKSAKVREVFVFLCHSENIIRVWL